MLRHTVALAQVANPRGGPPDRQTARIRRIARKHSLPAGRLEHELQRGGTPAALRPVGFHVPIVQAQRREAWGEPPTDSASSAVCPRPYGRSAFTCRLYKPNAVRRGVNHRQTQRPAWFARGLTAGRLEHALQRNLNATRSEGALEAAALCASDRMDNPKRTT